MIEQIIFIIKTLTDKNSRKYFNLIIIIKWESIFYKTGTLTAFTHHKFCSSHQRNWLKGDTPPKWHRFKKINLANPYKLTNTWLKLLTFFLNTSVAFLLPLVFVCFILFTCNLLILANFWSFLVLDVWFVNKSLVIPWLFEL